MNRLLVVDDEPRITAFIEKGLRRHGFTTVAVHDGEQAAAMARDDAFDLLIVDLGLPGCDGFEVIRRVRARGERLPILVLTAEDGIDSTVRGFEQGADDYLTKPFRFDELLVRVRARLREPGRPQPTSLDAGGVHLDLRARVASVDGHEVALSSREFALAEVLMANAGNVLSREQLLSRVWGYDFDGGSNVVEVYVRYLRRKLGAGVIETVRGSGYRFVR
jgi:DNA-binding response OmpR family regulator